MSRQDIKDAIRNVANFPTTGIQFKDITTALKKPKILTEIIEELADHYSRQKIDYVAGIESRGFIFGAALAYKLGCGFIPIRKAGKLPAAVLRQEYALEYGNDTIEMHADACQKGDNVLIFDDLLATGGTAAAAAALVEQAGATVAGLAFMVELSDLGGKAVLEQTAPVFSLVQY